MALSLEQQIKEIIEKSRAILLTCNKNLDGDSIGSALSLFFVLEKMGKKVILALDEEIPLKYKFLPQSNPAIKNLSHFTDLIISCDLTKKDVKEVYYEKTDGQLKIHLVPKNETEALNTQDLRIENGKTNFELIVTINSPDFGSLGDVFYNNTSLFYEIPVLNIDHKSLNENYGEINLVEITASSSSEILTDLFKSLYEKHLDDNIATCLLAGLIAATHNFQNKLTSPKTLHAASYLIENKARHQEILKHFYKVKNLAGIKLFGRVLMKLQKNEQKSLSYACIPKEDFDLTLTSPADLKFVLNELRENMGQFNPFLILWENKPNQTMGVLLCQTQEKIQSAQKTTNGLIKDDLLFFRPDSNTLEKALEETLSLINF